MTDVNTNSPSVDEKSELKIGLNENDDAANAEVDLDDSKAKFLNGGKGIDDSHVVVEVSSASGDVSFTGLGKEELMRYANDPFWVRLRLALFIVFWVGWLAMLVAAIVIIVLAPRCPTRPDQKWYNTAVVYKIFPKSFQDSNVAEGVGAGVGDLKGIQRRLEYFDNQNVKALWLQSIYPSARGYDGNDVTDHKMIDAIFGTDQDFGALVKVMKKKGIKLILDFIPNHTSKNHTWFQQSREGVEKYKDYYVWSSTVPNQWKNAYGDIAWTFDDLRQEYYYHRFLADEPDLNLRNPAVREELTDILKYWLGRGVNGFHVVGTQYLMEDEGLMEETTEGEYTQHQAESVELLAEWRKLIDQYSDKPGREKVLIATVTGANENQTMAYYGNDTMRGAHIVPTMDLTSAICTMSATMAECVNQRIDQVIDNSGDHWRGWMLGDSDTKRVASDFDTTHMVAMQTLQMLLPGTAFSYYGDEIGMKDVPVSVSLDPTALNRDRFRSPMQWTSKMYAGFSEFKPWIEVHPDYRSNNVEFQKAHFKDNSLLNTFGKLTELRQSESFQFGKLIKEVLRKDILWFTRKAEGFPGFLVVMNLGSQSIAERFGASNLIPSATAEMVFHSENIGLPEVKYDLATRAISLGPGDVVVFKYM